MATESQSVTQWTQQPKKSKPRWTPHGYQKKAIKFLIERHAAALFLSPGLGKTSITYASFKLLKGKGLSKGMLVVAPLRPVYSVWPAEQKKWEDFEGLSVGVLHGKHKDDVLQENHDVFVINFEGLEWLLEGKNMKILLQKVDILAIDELSKLKNTSSKRFKLFKPWLHRFNRRWGLTGSPAANSLMDVFGQAYVLDLGKAFGPYITHFRNKFFTPGGFNNYEWKLQDGGAERIYQCLAPLALTMQAEDYLKMPTLIPVTIYVDLPPAARKIYDEMEDELFAKIEGKEFVASNAAGASIKCQQIANGALYHDVVDALTGLPVRGPREWQEVHTAKLDAMLDLIEELQGSPTLWAYHFGHDLERIVGRLGKATAHMDVAPKVGEKLVQAWNRNELATLFCQPASVGHGLNLQEGQAGHVAYFSPLWDRELYDQFNGRIRRQGNGMDRIFVYHIVARNTVDEAKMRALTNKGKSQQALLDALKQYRHGR